MQKDERDLLEVLKFDLVEETVGSWLRAIIQCLEKEQAAIRRDQRKESDVKPRNVGGASRPQAPSEVCKAGVSDQTRVSNCSLTLESRDDGSGGAMSRPGVGS